MGQVVTLENFRPPRRYDSVPWAQAVIEEAATVTGDYTEIDTIALSPVDADPSIPALRSFTTDEGTGDELWYRVIFEDGAGNVSLPTTPIQNAVGTGDPYATVDELTRILFKRTPPTASQTVAMQRVLVAAAGEIDAELGRGTATPLAGWELSLAATVNLDRAQELWQQQDVAFGIVTLGDAGAIRTATDTWKRHGEKLAPLKRGWGIA
jgi:hypothetical protein